MMQLKSYYKMCKHCGNDEGCDAAMDAMCDLLNQSSNCHGTNYRE